MKTYKYNGLSHSNIKLYNVWYGMYVRCTNTKSKFYHNYGGRGITVDTRWSDFSLFLSWAFENGYKKGLSLDRIDNDKGYSPENCRWATRIEQCRNRRSNSYIEYNGKKYCFAELRDISSGIPDSLIRSRILNLGWTIERAITQPIKHKKC